MTTAKKTGPKADERAFNETLKRMLQTPPKPKEKAAAISKKKGRHSKSHND